MLDSTLSIYVTQALRNGIRPEALRKALHVSGWDDADIDAVFQAVGPVRANAKHSAKARANGVAAAHAPRKNAPTWSVALMGVVAMAALASWLPFGI